MRTFKLKFLLIAFVLSTFANALNAAIVSVDKNKIRYSVDNVAMTAEVYGPVSSSTTITDLVIPDYIEYNGKQVPVTSIRDYAFDRFGLDPNENLKGSLKIGNNIQTIGERAFHYCSYLTGSLIIPDNVKTVGAHAFYWCSGLKGLKIGKGIKIIDEGTFERCEFEDPVFIGENVKEIR